jgi:hypothetical protein
MKYKDFQGWVEKNCMHEAFYKDSEGRIILVITELDAWVMCNKFANGLEETNEDPLYQPTSTD